MSILRITMAALLALAMAIPAMAFDVNIKGDFNNRFLFTENADVSTINRFSGEANRYANVVLPNDLGITEEDGSDDSEFSGEFKYRLWFDATDDEKKVRGVLGFEFGGRKYGDTGADFGGDDNVFELMNAYTEFEVPFDTASRLSLGLQPVGLNRWVWSDNAAGVKYASKRGELGYSLSWFRNAYSFNNAAGEDSRNVYSLDVTYTPENLPKFNVFAIYSWEDEVALMQDQYTDSDPGEAGLQPTTIGASKDTEIWLGAAIDGQAGPLFYGATAVYLTGEAEGGALAQDLDRKAYFLHGELTYKAGPARLKAGWMYASGDDDPNDGDLENYDVIDVYVPLGSVVIFDSYADDNTLSTSPYFQDKGYNMPYLGVDYDVNEKTTVGASWFWHNTAEDIEFADGTGEDEIGHEFAVRAAHKITKNLTAGIQAGYLFGGDAWDALGVNDDSDDVLVTDASIRLKF